MSEYMKMAVKNRLGMWPHSQECNGLLHFDWRNNQYYSDFYGSNEFVQLVGTKEEFEEVRKAPN